MTRTTPGADERAAPEAPEALTPIGAALDARAEALSALGRADDALALHLAAASRLIDEGRHDDAVSALDALAQRTLDHVEQWSTVDPGGATRALLRGCVRALERCLCAEGAPRERRRRVLRALVDVLDGDRLEVVSAQVSTLLLERCRADERSLVASWLRALDDEGDGGDVDETPWERLRHGALLFDLVLDELPDEALARACRLLGREAWLAEHALRFARVDEALAVARGAELAALPEIAEVFSRHERADELIPVIDARMDRTPDPACLDWLIAATRPADPARLHRWITLRFECAPTHADLASLRALATPREWSDEAARLADAPALRELPTLRATLLLSGGRLDEAIALARGTEDRRARCAVAEAVASSHPEDAVALWQRHVDALLAAGGVTSYREAVGYAQRVLRHAPPGEGLAWLKALRHKHIDRVALIEELQRGGLGSAPQ